MERASLCPSRALPLQRVEWIPSATGLARIFPLYLCGVLVCVTLTQKVIDQPQNRPFLYLGLGLVLAHIAALGIRLLGARVPRIGIAILVSGLIVAITFATSVREVRAIKDYLLMVVAHVGLLLSFSVYFGPRDYEKLVVKTAQALLFFAVGHAVIAWWLLAGGSFGIGAETYYQQPVFGLRLHGVAGEPAHFGAIQAVAFLSALFLFTRGGGRIAPSRATLLVFLFASLVMSGARNAAVSLLTGFLVYLLCRFRRLRLSRSSRLLLCVAGAFLLYAAFSSQGQHALRDAFRIGDPGSEELRMQKYADAAVTLAESRPLQILVGRGFTYMTLTPTTMNQYVDVFFGFGIIGLGVLIVAIVAAAGRLYALRRARPDAAAYGLGLLAFSTTFFMMLSPLASIFYMPGFVFYVALYMAFSRYRKCGLAQLRRGLNPLIA